MYKSTSELPYTELPYIIALGISMSISQSCYIDSGINVDNNTGFKMFYRFRDSVGRADKMQIPFGVYINASSVLDSGINYPSIDINIVDINGIFYDVKLNSEELFTEFQINYENNRRLKTTGGTDVVISPMGDITSISIDGKKAKNVTIDNNLWWESKEFDIGIPMHFGVGNYSLWKSYFPPNLDMGEQIITDNKEVVYHGKPAKMEVSGVMRIGLYDIISNTFKYSPYKQFMEPSVSTTSLMSLNIEPSSTAEEQAYQMERLGVKP